MGDDDVRRLQRDFGVVTDNWSIELDYHFGGFARRKPELDQFIVDFRERHGIELEWVYVAKMIYGLSTRPAVVAALRAPWFWVSDPTVSCTIEALAADTPAALKAVDTAARAKARAVVSGSEMGQPRIAVVSRVNWRWPISL